MSVFGCMGTDAGHTVLHLTSTGNSKASASHTSLLEYLIHVKYTPLCGEGSTFIFFNMYVCVFLSVSLLETGYCL